MNNSVIKYICSFHEETNSERCRESCIEMTKYEEDLMIFHELDLLQ